METRLMKIKSIHPKFWESKDNKKISCKEKILILNNNIVELHDLINQIYDEAILMGVKKKQIQKIISDLANNLDSTLTNDK